MQDITDGQVVDIEGKRFHRCFNAAIGKSAIHIVRVEPQTFRISLGQVAVDKWRTGIPANPKLLEMLEIAYFD